MTDNDMMIKVFISQPMRGKTYEQVMKEQGDALRWLVASWQATRLCDRCYHRLPKECEVFRLDSPMPTNFASYRPQRSLRCMP